MKPPCVGAPARSKSASRVASTRFRKAGKSTPTSLPFRFTTLPATITVSTLPICENSTTALTGLFTGMRLIALVSMRTISASLPGVRLPVR